LSFLGNACWGVLSGSNADSLGSEAVVGLVSLLLVEFFKVVWLFSIMSVMVVHVILIFSVMMSMMSMFVVHVIIIISVMVSVFLVVKLLQFAPSVAFSMELSAITLSSLAQLIELTAFVHR
jgi:hypothetical protein